MASHDLGANLDDDRLHILTRFLELLEQRASQRRVERSPAKRNGSSLSRAAWVRRQCPADIEAARAAFLSFSVPPARRLAPPPDVRGFVRLVLFRSGHSVGDLSPLLDDGGRFAIQKASAVLHGQRRVSRAEWRRLRERVLRLAEGLELEPASSGHGGEDLGTVASAALAERLGRRALHWREKINGEVVGQTMLAPFSQANARDADRAALARLTPPVRRQRFGDVSWVFA